MIGAVGKSREMTRIRRDMAAGHYEAAIRRLQTLAAVNPTDHEAHDLLVAISRKRGDLAGAGRWGFLSDAATPAEISAFESAHTCPWVRLRLLRWSGDPEAVQSPAGRARLMELAALAEQVVRAQAQPDPLIDAEDAGHAATVARIPRARRPAESEPGYPELISGAPTVDVDDEPAVAEPAHVHSRGERRALRKAHRQAERERRRALRREVRKSTVISVAMIVLLLLLGSAGSLGMVDTMRVAIARFAALVGS